MVKFSTTLLVAAVVAGPTLLAFAQEHPYEFDARELTELNTFDLAARADFSDLASLTERDIEELYTRDPNFFKKIFGGVKRVVGGLLGREIADDLSDLTTRELEELDARDPFIGKIFRGVRKVAGGLLGFREFNEEELEARDIEDVEELDARDPFIGKIFRGVRKVAGGLLGFRELDAEAEALSARGYLEADLDELLTRDIQDLQDLELREPFIGKIFRGIKRVAGGLLGGREFDELNERDLEELYERDPNFFKKIFGGVKRVAGALLGRDVEDIEELSERELDELEEREPFFGLIRAGARVLKKGVGLLGGRELDLEDELLEREIMMELEELD